jgi:single-strand DNA-binding protein
MNTAILIGRLVRDPETRYTQSGKAVCSFTLAIDRRGKDNGADFIPCVAWDKLAEVIANNLSKGRRIGVEGRLQSRQYETKDGGKRTAYEVVVGNMEFLDSKAAGQQADNAQSPPFGAAITDAEIPF